MARVRAKFYVETVQPNEDGSGTIRLRPVYDGSEENKAFYKYTPGGEITLSTINPQAVEAFEVGAQFYVDFTPAVDPVPPNGDD